MNPGRQCEGRRIRRGISSPKRPSICRRTNSLQKRNTARNSLNFSCGKTIKNKTPLSIKPVGGKNISKNNSLFRYLAEEAIFYDREGITDQDFNGGRFISDGEKADRSKKQRIKIQKSDNKIGAKTRRAADTNGAAHMSRNGKIFFGSRKIRTSALWRRLRERRFVCRRAFPCSAGARDL